MFSSQTVKHNIIDRRTLEIDYTDFYTFAQNGKISELIYKAVDYFTNNPIEVENQKIALLTEGLRNQDFSKLLDSNLDDLYNKLS